MWLVAEHIPYRYKQLPRLVLKDIINQLRLLLKKRKSPGLCRRSWLGFLDDRHCRGTLTYKAHGCPAGRAHRYRAKCSRPRLINMAKQPQEVTESKTKQTR